MQSKTAIRNCVQSYWYYDILKVVMSLSKMNILQQVRLDSGDKSLVKRGLTGNLDTQESSCKKHLCSICGYTSNETTTFKRHLRTHTGEKPFLCPHCSVRTTRKASLLSHMLSHTGEKPYSCHYCPYESRQKGNLIRHMKIHQGQSVHHPLSSLGDT